MAGLCGLVPLVVSPQALADEDCAKQPTHIQLLYGFPWSPEEQSKLAYQFESECRSQPFLRDLMNEIEVRLANQGIRLSQITIMPEKNPHIVTLRLQSNADSTERDFSTLLPLIQDRPSKIITSLDVIGDGRENSELVARYTVNETLYRNGGGKLTLRWLRDGKLIEDAKSSRYILQRADVGARISAQLRYSGGDKGLFDQYMFTLNGLVMAANYPPRIDNLIIDGRAETGSQLTARYDFIDENEGDIEEGTSFIWLRDNIVIEGANSPDYNVSAKDIGSKLAVRIIPRSADGQLGKPRIATLDELVRAKPVIADEAVVENIMKQDADKALDIQKLEERITDLASQAAKAPTLLPAPRPDVMPDAKAAPVPEEIAPQDKDQLAEDTPADLKREKEAPALIIIDEDEKAPEIIIAEEEAREDKAVKTEQTPIIPPLSLTEGFEIAATSPREFVGLSFTDTAILPEYQLKAIEKNVIGAPISLSVIKTVLEEVNALYLSSGFELSRALLPEQIVTDGVVAIQLVEARVGKIIVENINKLDEQFVRDHLAAEEGGYISLAQLERSIRIYNLSNKSNLATELAPGEGFGETDIFVDVAEPDEIELPTVSVNNYANKTSDWRNNTFSVTINNTFGIDDETSVSYSDAKGSTSQAVSYSMPLDRKGTNISVSLSNSDTKIVAGSEETVGYRGSATALSASYSVPLLFGDEYSIYLSGTYGQSKSDLVQPVTGLMLSKSQVRKFSLSMPYSYNNGTTAWSFAPAWHVINTITEIPKNEKWMQKFDANASLSHFLNDKWTANMRGNILYTDARDMINLPSEILSVGGPGSVRAYQPAESSGYQGYFVTGELRTDLSKWEQVSLPSFMPSAQFYAFADHMMAQTQYKVRNRHDYWSGYGVGFQIPSIFNLLTFDIYWAEPLDGEVHAEEKDFYDDELFQFSLSARFRLQ